mgnify:CR=1 FL=1
MDLRNGFLRVYNSEGVSGSLSVTGSQYTSGSSDVNTVQGSTAGGTLFNVLGTSGQLFTVTDGLSGSLFSVNTISGLPLLEVFSDETINIGKFGAYGLKTSGSQAIITGSMTGSLTGTTTLTTVLVQQLHPVLQTYYQYREQDLKQLSLMLTDLLGSYSLW